MKKVNKEDIFNKILVNCKEIYIIESTLQDVLVYKAGVVIDVFLTKKVLFSQVGVTSKFANSMIFKNFEYFDDFK